MIQYIYTAFLRSSQLILVPCYRLFIRVYRLLLHTGFYQCFYVFKAVLQTALFCEKAQSLNNVAIAIIVPVVWVAHAVLDLYA